MLENEIWPLTIYEVALNQDTEFEIIWEWHIWDHLIQDVELFIFKKFPSLIIKCLYLINYNYTQT